MKWNGWFTGAFVTGVLAAYTGWWNEHYVLDNNMNRRYSCGSVFNPIYPKDGLGPCTSILERSQWVPWLWIIATIGLALVGYAKQSS
jgi:hypothetical protein